MVTWIPPESPYDLLQERFWPDGWKILIVCLLLNQTSRKQVEPIIAEFFEKFPNPEVLVDCDENDLKNLIRPLGLVNRRAKTLKRFSEEFVTKTWENVNELYGCGKYANDTYTIFVKGEWRTTEPQDHALNDYYGFLLSREYS